MFCFSTATLISYHCFRSLSTTFLTFFNLSIEALCFSLSLSDSFIILAPVPVFVNTIFQFFSTFFKNLICKVKFHTSVEFNLTKGCCYHSLFYKVSAIYRDDCPIKVIRCVRCQEYARSFHIFRGSPYMCRNTSGDLCIPWI